MHLVLVNRLGGLNLLKKSVARLTDRLTIAVYSGRKATTTIEAITIVTIIIIII